MFLNQKGDWTPQAQPKSCAYFGTKQPKQFLSQWQSVLHARYVAPATSQSSGATLQGGPPVVRGQRFCSVLGNLVG